MLSLRRRDSIGRHPQSGMFFWAWSWMHGWSQLLCVQDAQKVLANGPRHRLIISVTGFVLSGYGVSIDVLSVK